VPAPASDAAVVVVPVKAFSKAKMRLASVLAPDERAALARKMAAHVIAAAHPLPVVVVCDDVDVSVWARTLGAGSLLEPGLGLNGAVSTAFSRLGTAGYKRLIVVHADLPLATNLARLADLDGIALAPDRRQDGTNAISVPAGCGFRFAYGPGSFERHTDEARRTGLPLRIVNEPELAWDVDFPADMEAVAPQEALPALSAWALS
jgi:2-phospho-L-lactate guanylyltransferase